MATGYITIRIKSGLYYSTDGNFKIQRRTRLPLRQKEWEVFRMSEGVWTCVQSCETLAEARKYVGENVAGWWG